MPLKDDYQSFLDYQSLLGLSSPASQDDRPRWVNADCSG
jgi:hypothetical protein